jgi:hypothetical protein
MISICPGLIELVLWDIIMEIQCNNYKSQWTDDVGVHLMAMLQQLDLPLLFVTLSVAGWSDLLKLLPHINYNRQLIR